MPLQRHKAPVADIKGLRHPKTTSFFLTAHLPSLLKSLLILPPAQHPLTIRAPCASLIARALRAVAGAHQHLVAQREPRAAARADAAAPTDAPLAGAAHVIGRGLTAHPVFRQALTAARIRVQGPRRAVHLAYN